MYESGMSVGWAHDVRTGDVRNRHEQLQDSVPGLRRPSHRSTFISHGSVLSSGKHIRKYAPPHGAFHLNELCFLYHLPLQPKTSLALLLPNSMLRSE